jgi:hypothetical protein
MRRSRVLTLALVAAGGLLVAACGSDAEPLSKPEFIAQANAICQASFDETEPMFEALFGDEDFDPDDPANEEAVYVLFAEAMDEIEPILDQQLDDIRALEPPAADKELIESIIADQDAALTEFIRMIDDAAAGDETSRAQLENNEDDDLFDDVDQQSLDYGLTVCGSNDG